MKRIFRSKIVVFVTILALIASLAAAPAVAAVGSRTAELMYRDIKITLNGRQVTAKDVDGKTIEPFIIDGTTYLPVRGLSTILGLNVNWVDETSTVALFSQSEMYYIVRASEMYDEFVALFGSMYWALEQMNHLNESMYYEQDTADFDELQKMHSEWVSKDGFLSQLITGVRDIIADLEIGAKEGWLKSALADGNELLELTQKIHPLLETMLEKNRQCHDSGDGYDEFMTAYYDALDLLYKLDRESRDGQLAANVQLRERAY